MRVATQTTVAAGRIREQYQIDPARLTIVPNAAAPEHQQSGTDAGRRLAARMRESA